MKAERSDAERGYTVYTKRTLAFYDWWVLGFSNRFIWRCPTEKLVELYREHVSDNHLEVGVGTGYFLEHADDAAPERLVLLDANRACLDKACARLADRADPEVFQVDVLEGVVCIEERFDSIALNYLFHCLPGPLGEKAGRVLDNLAPHLNDDGVVFGSTILGADIRRPFLAVLFMSIYNRKGIFCNHEDSLAGIMEALSSRFRTFNVEVEGCVVLFWAKGKRE